MKMRHIKFVWGGPEVIKGRWYLRLVGFYGRTEGAHDDGLALNVRGLLPWLLGAAVAAWLLAAAALSAVWQRNPYSLLTYSDALFFPFRRAEIHDKNGQALIARGTDALRAKRWNEAVACLRQGLALHPHDWRASLTLAEIYVATNQRPTALRLLQEGLTDEFPGRAYLAGMFGIAENAEDFDVVVKTAERYRPALRGDADRVERRWLVMREFTALMGGRKFAEALALAEAQESDDTSMEQRVLALLESRRRDEALNLLAEWRARPGADGKVVARLSVRAFREARQLERMEQTLAELRRQTPAEPQVYVYGVVQQAMTGREAPAKAALEEYLFRFGGSPQNLLLVAEPLAEIANLPLLDRCAAAASERGYAAQPYQMLQLQALMKRGEWDSAARTLAEMKPPAGTTAVSEQLWRDWMQRLLDAVRAPGDVTALGLTDFMRSRPWPVKIFRTTVEALRRANRRETARDVLGIAQSLFPASAWVAQQAADVAQEIAAQPAAAAGIATLPGHLSAPGIFFQQLEAALNAGQWSTAGQLIREARNAQPAPDWLSSRDGELRRAEMRVAQAGGERSRMIAAATVFLNGDADRSRQALELARTFFTQGDRDSAIALATEVMHRSPRDAAARKLLSEWRASQAPQAAVEPGRR